MKYTLLFVMPFIAGCTAQPVYSPEQEKTVVRECIEETQAPGTYSVVPGRPSANPEGALPRARAVQNLGGTSSGADAINACIQHRAAT